MKLNWKYIAFIVFLFGIYFVFQASMPKYYDWSITFYHLDKNPYGGKVFYDLLQKRFDEVEYNFHTIYEAEDDENTDVIILAQNFSPDEADLEALFDKVGEGSTALIAAQNFVFKFRDTLNLEVYFPFDGYEILEGTEVVSDSISLRLTNKNFSSGKKYIFPKQIGQLSFTSLDTVKSEVLAVNDDDYPVLVSYPIGEGELLICSTPLIFTNYALLLDDNYLLAERILSYFGQSSIQWFQYYQMGRMESPSPMRYVLSELPLKWAFYTVMSGILLFMFFQAKRKQKIIPVVEPLKNHTLNFTRVIGRLYHQKKDHRDLAWKKIVYFHEYALTHYFVDVFQEDEDMEGKLAQKAGRKVDEAKQLLNMIQNIKNSKSISSDYLFQLNKLIDKFYITDSKTN